MFQLQVLYQLSYHLKQIISLGLYCFVIIKPDDRDTSTILITRGYFKALYLEKLNISTPFSGFNKIIARNLL